jgi:adenosine/AMP kinase
VVIADNGVSRAILGVFDGEKPKGIEGTRILPGARAF